MARPVAYGQAFGGRLCVPVPVAASQSFRAEGGKFVCTQSTGLVAIASGAGHPLTGWAEVGTFSSSSTAGGTIVAVNVADDAVFEMPVVSAISESLCKSYIGKTTDLEVISDIQYVNYDAASVNNIKVVGYKFYGTGVGEQSLLVKMYPRNASAVMIA